MENNNPDNFALPRPNGTIQWIAKQLSEKRITLTRLFIVIFLAILLWGYHPWHCSVACTLLCKIIGFLMVAICVAGRIWSATYIGGRKTRILVAEGPYSMVRHPLYLFTFIGAFGIGLSSMNTIMMIAIGIFLMFYYPGVVYYEEQKMLHLHGDSYREYMKTVPRLIPNVRLFKNPDELTIKPRKFQRDLIHALYFFFIYLLFETVDYLRTIQF